MAPYIGKQSTTGGVSLLLSASQYKKACQVARVIRVVSKLTPWRCTCFVQALLARILLGAYKVPYTIYFGVCREPVTKELQAHAWVASGPVNVSGGKAFGRYAVVGVFCSLPVGGL